MDFKEFLKTKGISEEDFAKKTPAEMAQLHSEHSAQKMTELEAKIDKAATPDQVQSAKDELEAFKTQTEEAQKAFVKAEELEAMKERFAELETKYNEQAAEITKLNEKKESKTTGKLKFDKETIESIKKSLDDASNRNFEFGVKALVLASTAVNNNTYAFREDGIDDIAHRKVTLLDVFPRTPLPANHSGMIKWREWDEATTAAVVTAIEEGAAFPEMTLRWKEESAEVKKIGTSVPVTEEFGMDEATLYAEIEDFFRDYVMLFEEEQIRIGNNATGQLNGYSTQSPVYAPQAEGVQNANIFDLALSVKADINRGKGSRINADTIVMNLGTINRFLRTKDTDNNYVWAPWVTVTENGISIDKMRVIESNLVADNAMDVFDSSKGRIFEYEEYKFMTGHVNNQFAEDEATLKARKRMLFRIKSNDLQAFRSVTDITAALTAIQA